LVEARAESYGLVGALAALPLRLAVRQAARHGDSLHRGITRKTTAVVFGRTLLVRKDAVEIENRLRAAREADLPVLSESGLLRALGSRPRVKPGDMSRQTLIDQSRVAEPVFDLLALFDCFETHGEPFSFRDLILARKYAGLLAGGAGWSAIARSVHRIGPVGALTALTLEPGGSTGIVSRDAASLAELDGQRLLELGGGGDDAEDYFGLAETAEASELFGEAATLYGQCVALDPTDATAAFNQGNCLRALGDLDGARHAYAAAIKRDADFVEAWFNLGGVLRDLGRTEAARQHLSQAIARDPDYADAIYNLAALEFDAGDLASARTYWRAYLERDDVSDWARRARAGIALADRSLRKSAS
jgi:tetratricopeptide (TPR) repeat protein